MASVLTSHGASIFQGEYKKPTIANAAAFREAYFDAVTEEDFENSMHTNAVGPYWLTFAFLPLLEKWKESPGGTRFAPQVVMTSSMNGWTKAGSLSELCDTLAHTALLRIPRRRASRSRTCTRSRP